MAYKWSVGKGEQGDIVYSTDLDQDTKIDFEEDIIKLVANGTEYITVSTGSINVNLAGTVGVDQYIYHNGDENTLINFADDKIILKAGGKAMITMEEKASSPHEVTINDGGNNIDFVVKGNGSNAGNPAFKVDASNNRVGINGVGSPSVELDVNGDVNFDGAAVFNESSADKDFRVESNHHAHMFYIDGGNNRIGIGTNSPQGIIHIVDPFDAISGFEKDAVIIVKSKKETGIKLISDSANTNTDAGEANNPFIDFYQDGQSDASGRGQRNASIAMEGNAGTTFTGSLANAFFMDCHVPNSPHSSRPLQIASDSINGGHTARITLEGTNGYVGIHTSTPSTEMEVIGTTKSDFFATDVTTQDLGSGTSSTLSTNSGIVLLDAGSINGADIGGGMEAHILSFPTPSISGQKLTIIAKNADTNSTMVLPSGLISGSFTQLHDASGISVLSFVWVTESGHAAWYQV